MQGSSYWAAELDTERWGLAFRHGGFLGGWRWGAGDYGLSGVCGVRPASLDIYC